MHSLRRRRSTIALTVALAAALTATMASPAAADVAEPLPTALFETTPSAAAGISADAVVYRLPYDSSLSSLRHSLQTVTDPSTGTVRLETISEDSNALVGAVDLSSHLDTVSEASSTRDYTLTGYPLVVYVRGALDGSPVIVKVVGTSGSSIGTTDEATVTTIDAASFETASGIELQSVVLATPFATGTIVAYREDDGTYAARRLDTSFAIESWRTPFDLPGEGEERSIRIDSYGNVLSSRDGGLDVLSVYSPASVSSAELPGVGVAAHWSVLYGTTVIADAEGDVAIVSTSGTPSLVASVSVAGGLDALTVTEATAEVVVAPAGSAQLRRFSLTDGSERTPIELAGETVTGSMSSTLAWSPSVTLLTSVDGSVYRYRSELLTRAELKTPASLTVSERGAALAWSSVAWGTGIQSVVWEYSLDGGASWAERGAEWTTAIADIGDVSYARPALADPLDGVAPSLRQEAETDLLIDSSYGRYETAVAVDAAGYDALWRYRATNALGSVATEPTRMVIESELEADPALTVTTNPASARVTVGEDVTFTATASIDDAAVQWQSSADGESWQDVEAATSASLVLLATEDLQGRQYRAVFSSGAESVQTLAATLEIMTQPQIELDAAPEGAWEVSDATLSHALSAYSHEWAHDTIGEVATSDDGGFVFGEGSGWIDEESGRAQVLWDGTAIYRPYGGYLGLLIAISDPLLTVAGDGTATLTADVAWNDGGSWSGELDTSYQRVTIATFASVAVAADDEAGTVTGTPEWEGRTYVSDAGVHASSFPASFVDYLSPAIRAWFYTTGSSRDGEKKPTEVSASFSVTASNTPEPGNGDDGDESGGSDSGSGGSDDSDDSDSDSDSGSGGSGSGGSDDGTDSDLSPSETDLTAATRDLISAPAQLREGQTFAIAVGTEHIGSSVSAYLFSTPTALGTHTVTSSGTITVTLPEGVAGEHRLAVYAADGSLIGWMTVTISAAGVLAATGADVVAPLGAAIAALLLGAAFWAVGIRRRRIAAD
ncbi:MAG: HtaA domain-containing protein [Microbacterium sp.]